MFDCQFGELVAITVELAMALAAFFVEYENLVAFYQRGEYFAYYFGAFNGGQTHFYFAVVVNQQHFLKFNSLAVFGALHVVYEELLAFFSLELLTVNFYNCVHVFVVKRFFREADFSVKSLVRPRRILKIAAKLLIFFISKPLWIFFFEKYCAKFPLQKRNGILSASGSKRFAGHRVIKKQGLTSLFFDE